MTGRLADRVALVTGASRGIGAAVAKRLAREGAHIVLCARTVGGLEEVDDAIREGGGGATLVPLDLRDGAAIDRLGGAVAERWGRLDVLVGNAGLLGDMGPVAHLDPKVWDDVIAVNLTANWRLIRAFDALLRAAPAARVILVSSLAAVTARAYWGVYATSKAALEMLARTYAAEVANTTVRVNLVDPGPTRTGMRARAMPGEDPMTLPTPEDLSALFVELALPACELNGEVVRYREFARSGQLQSLA